MSEKIIGIVERIVFKNNENGYHILGIELQNNEKATITAFHPIIHEGLTYEFTGNWTNHPTYGKQMKSETVFEVPPNTKEGLRAYLSSSFFPGIGPALSQKIISYFKDDVIKVMNEDIDKLLLVPGISPKKLEGIKKSWKENDEINDIMMFLQQFGISTVYAAKIYKHYGNGCVQKIKENPYSLAMDVKGIGFIYADKIALEVGIEPESEQRLEACIVHILESGSLDGHCYLLDGQISIQSTELLKVDVRDKISDSLNYMVRKGIVMTFVGDDEEIRYYSKKLYYNENACANKIGELLLKNQNITISETIIKIENLSDEQKNAVFGVVSKGVSILTGGPGCGKTYTTKTIVDVLLKLGKNIAICAPTGKAALKSSSVIGFEACTIHRLLGWDPENFGFLHNEKNPLPNNFIIVEESSMIDINLMCSLLKAVSIDCQILFVGDHCQLSPVGPGAPFKDMIESNIVSSFKLNKIFRQAQGSKIITSAHKINNGECPIIESPLENPDLWKSGEDCLFIDSGLGEANKSSKEYPTWSSLRYGLDVVDMVKKLYIETINKYYNTSDIQILIPMKISDLGTIRINSLIQEAINPSQKNKNQIKFKDKVFREGDKVMHIVNNYDIEVFNGDIGWIQNIDEISGTSEIKFDMGRVVKYKKVDMLELEHAWAISIHKSQGSEFDCVILPIMPTYNRMLERSLIYTALTRSKKLAVFVGQRKSLEIAIKTINSSKRQTSLKELLFKQNEINSFIL